MLTSFALLCSEAPDPTRLEELASLAEAELLVVSEGPQLPLLVLPRLILVRPLAGRGPIALLHTALLVARGDSLVAIDGALPIPSPELLRRLAAHPAPGNLLLLSGTESAGPFPGRYRRGCLRALRTALARGEPDLSRLVAALPATVVDSQSLLQSIGLPSRNRRARRSSTIPQARSK